MEDVIVRAEGISKRYGPVDAVRGLSLAVRRGEFVSLLGPSGCGKSTILRMIAGFEQPDAGQIAIDGREMVDVPPNRRPVNMVFQSYALFPHLTVAENIAFGPRRQGIKPAEIARRVECFLQLVGLEGLGERYPAQLSGGQQQRVALARALVNQPKVLLLDEPLGALDLKLRKRMQVELKQLQREVGISFIYVTHDQEEALALSDRIAVMNRGVVLQYAPGREIYDCPETEFVANFLGEANILRGRVVERGSRPMVEVAGQRVAATEGSAAVPAVGETALIAIRPEHLQLAGDPRTSENVLSCEIEDKVFLGNAFVVYVRVGDGASLTVRGSDRALFDALPRGGRVQLGWATAMARLVSP